MILNNFHFTSVSTLIFIFLLTNVKSGRCPENETLVDMGSSCPDNACSVPADCPQKQGKSTDVMVCRCQPGYVRNYKTGNGTCIRPNNCPIDLEAECHFFKGDWIKAGHVGCEKSCVSPDICVHVQTQIDQCFCGLERVRAYWPDGPCIYRVECNSAWSFTKLQYLYLFICISTCYIKLHIFM